MTLPAAGNGLLDIVIVNWNAGELLADCIETIFASGSAGYAMGSVIVVDNASSDGSTDAVEQRWAPRVRVIRNSDNLGFGRACNIGAASASGQWILFLNPDTRLLPDTLSKALRSLEGLKSENVAVCGVKLVDGDGRTARSCARIPDWRMFTVAALGLDRIFAGANTHMMTDWDHESGRYVGHVIGAFYLMHRAIFEQVGRFDERFFVYLEDLDLSARVHAHGFRIYYSASAQAYHAGGGTSRKILARRLFYAQRSRLQYAAKHFSRAARWMVWGTTLLIEPVIRILHALLRLRAQDVWNVLKAYGLLYSSLVGLDTRSGTGRGQGSVARSGGKPE